MFKAVLTFFILKVFRTQKEQSRGNRNPFGCIVLTDIQYKGHWLLRSSNFVIHFSSFIMLLLFHKLVNMHQFNLKEKVILCQANLLITILLLLLMGESEILQYSGIVSDAKTGSFFFHGSTAILGLLEKNKQMAQYSQAR